MIAYKLEIQKLKFVNIKFHDFDKSDKVAKLNSEYFCSL